MTIKLKNPIILVFLVLTMILVMTTAGEAKPVSLSHKNQTDNNILIYEDQQKTESTAGKQKLMTSGDEEDPFPDPERDNTKRELNSPGTKEQVAKAIKGNSADTGRLIAVTPEDGSCEVDPLAEVSATFCVTLDNNTVNKNNVILESLSLGEIISDYSVIYSEYNNKIKILPYSALCNSTSYRITLKSALRDTKGRSVVDSDYSWTFTTKGDPSASIFDDYRNCRVMAGCGERLAWLQYTSRDGYRIYAADLITGKAKNISLLKDGIASDDVQLAIYEQGAVWAIKNSDGWELTYYDPEKAQEASIAEGLPEAPCPDIWGENIVYVDCSQGEGDIWLYNTGDGTRQAVCSAPGEQSQPRISQNYIVWEDNRNGNSDIYAYDLSQKTEKEVITSNTAQTDPDIWENTVVWHDDYINGCGIYYADLSGDISPQKLIYDVQSNRVSPRIYGNKVSWQVGEYFGSTVYDGIFLSEIGSDEINAPYVGGKSKGQYFINDDYGIMLNNQLHEIYSFRLIPSNTDPLETRYVFPKPNSRGFRVESPVAVSFSRALDAATVNRDSFFLSRTDGTRVEAEITSDSASGLYLLRPVDHLAEGTVYTINLTSAICDLEGQALAPCSWSFTTAAHDALPLTIETNVISSYPTVFDSNLLFLANRQQLYRYDADFGGSALLYESPLLELGLKDWGLDYPPHCYGDNVVISSYNPDNLSYDMLVLDAATGEQKGKTKAPTEEVYPYTYGPWAAWLEMEGTDNLNKPGKLKIVDLNSGGSVEIAEKVYPYWFPCIAGNLVCWAGKETGRYQLHIKDLSKNSLWVDDTNNPQAYPFIWKDRIVWIEVTGQGFEIWYGQIGPEGIEERQAVVSSPGCECSRPFIYGNNIVWNEKQDGKWQIYCYNLAAGERRLLVDQENPALWGVFGNQVVWTQYDQAYQTIFEDPSPDVIPPAIPANLECYINDGDLEINWDRSPDDIEVVGYRLERSEDGINWSSLGVWYDYDINEERVGCQDIAPAQNCFYRISAYDAAGNCSEWTLPCQVQGENIPQLAVVSGNNQSQAPGKSLTEPLVLCLKDSFGQALSGVKVNLATVSGQAGFDPLDRITDENGQVQFKITVQGTGKIRLIAGCPELNGVEASIILYGIDASYSLTTVSGQDQSGLMGEILPQPFTVLLNDAGGQPIADCDVSFKVKSGTAKLLVSGSEQNASQEVTVITAADGTASVRVIPGFGENIINVSVTGLLQEAEFSCLGGSEALIAGSISNYTELYANHGYWDLEVYTTDELGNQGPVVTVDDHGKFSIPITGGVWTLGLKSVDEGQGMPIAFPAPCQVLVDTGETPVSLALIPAPVRVRGRVTDEEGHPFLSDWGYPMRVEVWASSLNHPLGPIVSSRKRTDDEGNFEFYLPTGSFTLGCWVQGYILPPDNRIEVTEQGPTEDIWIKIPRGKCDISGYTYNLNNKLSGVMVTAWSAEHGLAFDYSGQDGWYSMQVPAGTYELRAFHPEKGEIEMISSSAGRIVEINESLPHVDFQVNQSMAVLSGRVCCQDETRQPLAGALINAFNPVSRVRNSTRTNELGEYRLELPVSSDPYIIEVWHRDQGKALQIQETLAAAGSAVNRDMEVPAPAVLSGRICRNGQGVGGAVVSAWCISDNNYLSSKSDAEGIYRLSLQPGESYRISVWSKESGEKSFNITAAPDMTQDFELERLNTVRGRVELASGSKQVANAWVQLVDSSGKSRGAFSEEDGAFELQAPAGKYMLLVTKKGLFQNVVSEWNVGEVPVDTGSVSMDDAQAVITGFTSDPNNSPVAFAIVWARSSQGDVMGTRSDADGHYSLALYPGPWTLMAVHDNWQEISHSLTVSEAATSEANLVFTDAQLLDSPGLAHLKTEQGGLIKDQQNGMELLLPPGSTAIESEMSIVTARNDAVVPSSSQQPVISFDFSAYTAEGAAFKGILDQSMEARIRYYRSDLEVAGMVDNSAEESLLALSYYDEAAGDWVEVPAVQDVQDPDERGGGIFVVRSDHFTKFSVVKPSKLVLLGMRTDSSQQPGGGSGGTGGSGGGSSSVSNGSKPEETAQPAVSVNQNANAGPSRAVTAFVDTAGHWAAGIIAKMAQRGVIQGSEGRAYPDRPVNRAEFAVFLCRLLNLPAVQADLPFKDVPRDSWYYQSLQNLYIKGLMSGVANDQMAPEMMMTREQVAAILGRVANQVLNMQPSNKRVSSFKDKNQMASWSVEAIQQLSAAGIISGYPDGTFGPLRPITRAESLVCLEKMFPTGAAAR